MLRRSVSWFAILGWRAQYDIRRQRAQVSGNDEVGCHITVIVHLWGHVRDGSWLTVTVENTTERLQVTRWQVGGVGGTPVRAAIPERQQTRNHKSLGSQGRNYIAFTKCREEIDGLHWLSSPISHIMLSRMRFGHLASSSIVEFVVKHRQIELLNEYYHWI